MLFVCKGRSGRAREAETEKGDGVLQGKCAGRAGAEVGECLLQSGNMFSTLKIPENGGVQNLLVVLHLLVLVFLLA